MARQYSSNAVTSTIYSSFGSADATMVVSLPVTGWPTSYPFTVIVDPDTASEEVVTVTSLVTTGASSITYNVTRGGTGGDGTTAKTHASAAVVKHGVSARDFSEPQVHIDATVAHGATGAVVGTTNTQTLSGKTIDATSNTISNIANANIAAAAAIAVSKLASSSVTIGGSTATLGGSNVTSVTGMVLDATSTIGGISGTTIAAEHAAWTSWTPTFTNVTSGAGNFYYKQLTPKTLAIRGYITAGTATSVGTVAVDIPASLTAHATGTQTMFGIDNTSGQLRPWIISGGATKITSWSSLGAGNSVSGWSISGIIEVA